jgi:hypothetical protein
MARAPIHAASSAIDRRSNVASSICIEPTSGLSSDAAEVIIGCTHHVVEIDSAFAKEETRIALIAIDEYDHRDNTVSLIAEPLYN